MTSYLRHVVTMDVSSAVSKI